MEHGDMMLGVFPSFAFKLWDIQGEFMIGLLVNLERSGKSSVARNGNG